MGSVYQVNKGVGRPLVFKGLVGIYIGLFAGGLVFLLVLFAVLYICGVVLWVLLPLVAGLAAGLVWSVFALSRRFGQYGLGKFLARRGLPRYIRFASRGLFVGLRGGGRERG